MPERTRTSTSLRILDFESSASTIPPLRHFENMLRIFILFHIFNKTNTRVADLLRFTSDEKQSSFLFIHSGIFTRTTLFYTISDFFPVLSVGKMRYTTCMSNLYQNSIFGLMLKKLIQTHINHAVNLMKVHCESLLTQYVSMVSCNLLPFLVLKRNTRWRIGY